MRLKSLICIFMAFSVSFVLSGCSFLTVDTAELLSPPSLSGDISPIAKAIDKSVDGEYVLKYPSTGNFRSAVVQNDINNDGILEAFAFYSTTDSDVTTMHINAVCNKKGKWVSVAQQKIVAGGVNKIDFCDLDNDGCLEILVGWEIYGTSEMQLAVYSFNDDSLTQRMLQKYTHFTCCDLDENGINEIFVVKFSSSEQQNSASLYTLTEDGVSEVGLCMLDPTVKSVNEPVVATLSSGKQAIYIDEIKGVGAITEVVFYEKCSLVNPLFDTDSGETVDTLRSASLNSYDINNDGIVEIPVQEDIPSVARSSVNEKLYLTDWCSYNGETLTNQMTAMMNLNDGYYYIMPSKLINKIAVLKDTDKRLREIYDFDQETMTVGEKLFYIQAVNKSDWDKGRYSGLGLKEIAHDSSTSYICWISDKGGETGITFSEIKSNFKILE